ncbi:MAG: hypothetical protein ACXV5I_03245 [Halobacteriota archaeon]
MPTTPKPNQKSKLVTIKTVFVTDALHFETEYLVLRLTDAVRLVEKRERLIRSALACLGGVVGDDAQMGVLRQESALYDIKIDPDKERARIELQKQLVELKEQHKKLKAALTAVKAAAKSSRIFTPADFERVPPGATHVALASLDGKAIRFDHVGEAYLTEPVETADPRVVAALLRSHIGRPIIIG